MKEPVGILAVACHLPAHRRSVKELFQEEGIVLSDEIAARLGIAQVPIRNGETETASNMAVAAAREALQLAKVDPLHGGCGRRIFHHAAGIPGPGLEHEQQGAG